MGAGLRPGWMAQGGGVQTNGRTNGRTNERTNERTYGKSPHSTGLCPPSGPLPKKHHYSEPQSNKSHFLRSKTSIQRQNNGFPQNKNANRPAITFNTVHATLFIFISTPFLGKAFERDTRI